MKLFIMFFMASLVCAFPFNLELIEEHEIIGATEIRGITVPDYPALLIFEKTGAGSPDMVGYNMSNNWEEYTRSAMGHEVLGLAMSGYDHWWYNDITNDHIWQWVFGSTHTRPNPASDCWGIASFGYSVIWVSDGSDLWYINEEDTVFVSVPEISSKILGMTHYNGRMLAITEDGKLHCCDVEVGNPSLIYEGSIDIPVSASTITGIAWDNDYPDKLLIAYESGGSWYVGEFGTEPSALEQATWGEIKSSF
jgi:hypothetical protein